MLVLIIRILCIINFGLLWVTQVQNIHINVSLNEIISLTQFFSLLIRLSYALNVAPQGDNCTLFK